MYLWSRFGSELYVNLVGQPSRRHNPCATREHWHPLHPADDHLGISSRVLVQHHGYERGHFSLTIFHIDEPLISQALNCPDYKQPARAIPPHLRFLDAVAHLETPGSPDPLNSGTTGTASTSAKAKPFRVPARDFGSPYKVSDLLCPVANRSSFFVGCSLV